MSSPKSRTALQQLGRDVRRARLRHGMTITDLAARSGASASTLARLEKGGAGVALGTLAEVLAVLGSIERLAGLLDMPTDDLGLALTEERLQRRSRTFAATIRKRKASAGKAAIAKASVVDPDGVGF